MDNGDDDAIGGDLAKPWGKKKKKEIRMCSHWPRMESVLESVSKGSFDFQAGCICELDAEFEGG